MSVFGTIAGGVVQAGLGAINNTWAQQQQGEARRQNYLYGEMAAENADARTRALYNDFYSPQALMRQYREAGLSPSMMFGGTPGQGGTSGAQGSGAAGLGTPYMPMSMIEGAQIAKLIAETDNIKADTANKEGTGAMGAAQIAALLSEAGATEAAKHYTEAQTAFQLIENEIAENTKEWKEEEIRGQAGIALQNAEKAIWEAKDAKLEFDFNNETYKTRVEQEQNKTTELAAEIALKRQTKQLTFQQEKLVHNQIEKMWWDAAMKWQEFLLESSKVELSWNEFDKEWEEFCIQMGLEYDKMEYDARKTIFEGVTDIIKTGAAAAVFKGVKGKPKK